MTFGAFVVGFLLGAVLTYGLCRYFPSKVGIKAGGGPGEPKAGGGPGEPH